MTSCSCPVQRSLEEVLAVGAHPFDRAPVAALAELPALPIPDIVAERGGALEAERLELALVVDLPGEVPLAGDEAGPAVLAGSLDEFDLGFLAGGDDADLDVGDRLGDEPVGNGSHGVCS